MKVVVYGAGAVGCVLGGMLSLRRADVLLIGRSAAMQAIRTDGLRIKTSTGEFHATPRTAETLESGDAQDAIVLLAVKAHDVADAVATLARVARDVPVVCLQNGVESEATAAEKLATVYGGVVRMTCSMLQPAHVSYRSPGRVIVGRYFKGADTLAPDLVTALVEAGFDAAASRDIESDKWLKMAVNAQTAFHAVIDERDHDANEFIDLKVAILEETKRVLKAGKVKAKSCDGKDPSIDEMVAELKHPRGRRVVHGIKVHNSLWQDLYMRRKHIESDFIHGPLIKIGKEHGVATPLHATALDIAKRAHKAGEGPGTMRLVDVIAEVERRRASRK